MLRCSVRSLCATTNATASYEVIVSGGGLVGATVMAALQQLRLRLCSTTSGTPEDSITPAAGPLARIMMVDAGRRLEYDAANLMHQLRTVSITPVSSRMLDNLGAWSKLQTKHPYYRMAIRHEQVNSPFLSDSERSSPFINYFLGSKAAAEPLLEFTDLRKPVGFMCFSTELNNAVVSVVDDQMKQLRTGDEMRFETKIQNIKLPPKTCIDGEWGCAQVVSGVEAAATDVRFGLLLGCEGRGSPLRDLMGTASFQHDYAQFAFVCNVRIAKQADANPCCFQNFFRDGKIIAYLPTSDDTANIVFSTTPQHVRTLTAYTQAELVAELNARLHKFAPLDIPEILEVPEGTVNGTHKRAQGSFPLRLNVATAPYSSRALLVGDAAHGIHPFAGQGLNLGLYDVCALTEVIERAICSGQDVGSVTAVGEPYAAEMLAHTAPMISSMEAIKHISHGVPGLASLGMKALNTVPVISTLGKDAISQVASGALFAERHKKCFLLN